MWGFGFDVPAGDPGYQAKVEVHVIGEVRKDSLTPRLKPPPVVMRRVEESKWEVFFDYDSAVLRDEEKEKLTGVSGTVRVRGYASPEGSEEYNLKLSERRARSVAEYLKKKGVRVLEIRGMGERSCSVEPERWSLCRKVEVERE